MTELILIYNLHYSSSCLFSPVWVVCNLCTCWYGGVSTHIQVHTSTQHPCWWRPEIHVFHPLLLLSPFSLWKVLTLNLKLTGHLGWLTSAEVADVCHHSQLVWVLGTQIADLVLVNLLCLSFQPLSGRCSDSSVLMDVSVIHGLHRCMVLYVYETKIMHLLPDAHSVAASHIRCLHRLARAEEFLKGNSASLGHIKLSKNGWTHLSSHQH